MKEKLVYAARLLTVVATFLFYMYGYVCYERTLVVWWWPVAASAAVALSTSLPLSRHWRWLTGSGRVGVNRLCHIYVAGGVCYFLLLGLNVHLSPASSVHEETAFVVKKKTETRNITQRSGRRYRTIRRDVKYHYLYVRLENGASKRVPVSLAVYNRTRQDDSCTLCLQQGFFGFPVIRTELISRHR